jgi:hypothetical protein
VKKITLAVLLLLSAQAWAGGEANPAEYTIRIHVGSSKIDLNGTQVPFLSQFAKKPRNS